MQFVDGSPVSGDTQTILKSDTSNNKIAPGFSVFGDGVFETIFLHAGRLHLLDRHMQRMQRGASTLGLGYSENALTAQLSDFIEHYGLLAGTFRVRLLLSRAYSSSGYSVQSVPTRSVISAVEQALPDFSPLRINVSPVRLAHQPLLAGIKHCNRLENILAKQRLESSGFEEAVLLDGDGNVIECTAANLFMISGRELITPDLENVGVAGVMREFILQRVAEDLELTVTVRELGLGELLRADALFISSAIRGVNPVRLFSCDEGEKHWGDNAVFQQIRQQVSQSMLNITLTPRV